MGFRFHALNTILEMTVKKIVVRSGHSCPLIQHNQKLSRQRGRLNISNIALQRN